ncbi:nuclear transport factor 2 family protein [Staphylococcus xylosus]|uniref:nuclear transport factor 2 family protein n=1 Tax=Staphylococcus xylosus TaxID=1288 RepID=UPI0011AB2757|nr:nuclear transport factor 2 family protein [Staphylococcus xylosus]MCE7785482.1 nuclear transport factor 2 family protein [Staphylococcus xylosus]
MDKIVLKEQIENLYHDILINLDIEQIPKYFADEYIQITDHKVSNIDEFKNHLTKLKEVVKQLSITHFKTMMIDEKQNIVYLRYDVLVEKKSGFWGKIEVFAEFTFNKYGKVKHCNELTQAYETELSGIGSIS